MEGSLPQVGMITGGPSYGGLDMQGSMRHAQHQHIHHQHHADPRQGSSIHPSIHEGFTLGMGALQSCDPMGDYNKAGRSKNSASDEDDLSFTEEGFDGHPDASRGKKGSPWQRVKWTDKMVRLLITAVSYIGEDAALDCGSGGRRKYAVLQKKGKWKSVSKVMAERGYHVSPQQCEDKFNDLNKRYKRLNDVLGRGTSCQVVENPALLDVMDLTEKEKDDVRKILSSKHLFYEEMCSYHNGNRLHLPHDPALQRSLQLALKSRDDHDIDGRKHAHEDFDKDDNDVETNDHDELEEIHAVHGKALEGGFAKRIRQNPGLEDVNLGVSFHDCNRSSNFHPQSGQGDMNQVPDNARAALSPKQWMESCSLQLKEQKVQIQLEMLELEKQRFKWERFSRKRDRDLEKLRMENERMRLENERMSLELKQKEMGADYN